MALPLLSLVEPTAEIPGVQASYSLSLNEWTLSTLQAAFYYSPKVVPVLILAKDDPQILALIENLITTSATIPSDNFDLTIQDIASFASKRPPSETVFVWPRPLVVDECHILLLRMWDFDVNEPSEELKAIVQKALFCLAAVTGCCIAKFERNPYPELMFVQSLWEEMSHGTQLQPAHFTVIGEEAAIPLNRSTLHHKEDYHTHRYSHRVRFIPNRDVDNAERLLREMVRQDEVAQFKAAHDRVAAQIHCENHISTIAAILKIYQKVATFDCDFRTFVKNAPRLDREDFEQRIRILEAQLSAQQSILSASALSFFAISPENNQYRLDEYHLSDLRNSFDLARPTVVMVVLGKPGTGKSHFLNRIIQHCAHTSHSVSIFRTGSSGTHTTRASQVLSQPLPIPDSETQLMLIDLEGLGGMEIVEGRNAVLQQNLVASLLTIASVPCIIVSNEKAIQGQVEFFISKVNFCAHNFGFHIERILFLFYDKDYSRDAQQENEHMATWVRKLNDDYFEGRSVIRLMNKPNFVDPRNADMCEEFLSDFLRESDHPKQNASGSIVTMGELLTQIVYITEHASRDLSALSSKLRNLQLQNLCLSNLKQLFDDLTSNDDSSLVLLFNERFRKFVSRCPLALEPTESSRYIQVSLENQAQTYRLALTSIDNIMLTIRKMSQTDLNKAIKDLLNHYYKEAWWIQSFLDRCDDLLAKMTEVARRYPGESQTITTALCEAKSKRTSLRNWFLGNYAFQVTTTVATGSLGAAANASKAAITAARLGWGALFAGAAFIGEIFFKLSSSTIVAERAGKLCEVSPGVVKWYEDNVTKCLDESTKRVLVVVGTDCRAIARMLSKLVLAISPFTTTSTEAFDSGKDGQILQFQYPGQDTRGVIIFLPLQRDAVMLRIACYLLSHASVACVFEDQDSSMSRSLISDIAHREADELPAIPRLALYVTGAEGGRLEKEISCALSRGMIHFTLKRVDLQRIDSLPTMQLDLINCMDSARPVEAQDFKKVMTEAMRIRS